MNRNQWIAAAVVAAAAVIVLAAVAVGGGEDRDRGTLVVETNYDSAPFDYMAGDELVGIDIDLLRAVCDEMGYDLEFEYRTFDSIIDSVKAGNCDIGANGFTINDERKELVLFSDPYVTVEQVAVVPADSDIHTAADIKDKRITVKNGTTCADCAETLSGDIVYKKTYTETVQDLLTGNADCGFVNSYIAIAQVTANPGKLKVLDADLGFPSEDFGFVFSKDDAGLRDSFNAAMKEVRDSGLYGDIMDYYAQNGYSDDTPSFFSDSALVAGTSPHTPFTYTSGDGLAGIDMDILEALNAELGTSGLVKEFAEFDDIFGALADGSIDMGAAAVTINDERKDRVLFSDPYMKVRQVVIAGLDANYSLSDLKGLTVATQSDTTSLELAKRYGGRVLEFSTYDAALEAVLDGRADCEITDNLAAQSQIAGNPGLKPLDILDYSEEFGFIFAKDDAALRDRVNVALGELRDDGMLDNILDYYDKKNYSQAESFFVSDDVITIGTFPVVAPFNYLLDGKETGIDIDLVTAITDSLGLGRHMTSAASFQDILDGVMDGRFDMGVSEISITDERKETMLFSDPYADLRQVLVVKSDRSYSVSDLKDLTIASQSPSTSLAIAQGYTDRVLGFGNYGDAMRAVLDGRADCEITDSYVAQAQVSANQGLKILDILDNPEQFGFVFSKDNAELRDRVNQALEDVRKSGLRDDIFGYYEKNRYEEVESYFDSDEVVSIVTFPELPPFDYRFDGKVAGIDIDILRAVGHEMGVSVMIRESATFDGVLDGVRNGEFDIGSSGVTVTEERQERFLFSDPYVRVDQILLVKAGADYSVPDLKGLRLATHYDTTSLDVAKRYGGEVLVFASYEDAADAVLEGRADCVVIDNFSAGSMIGDFPGLRVLDILDEHEDFAFMFSKDNTELRDKVNAALKELKADGTLDNIFGYYGDSGYAEVGSYFDSDRVVKVGSCPMFPPFDYYLDGEITGIDADILEAIGMKLGTDIVTDDSGSFENVFRGTDIGDYDMGASGITVTPERQEDFLFSVPYTHINEVVVVKQGTVYGVSDLGDLTIAVQNGTTSVEVAKKYSGMVVIFQVFDDAMKAVLDGSADCAIIDDIAAKTKMASAPGLDVLDILDDREDFAFLFSKDDTALRDRVNAALKELKADGTLDAIFGYYEKNGYREVVSYFDSEDYRPAA